VVAGADKLLERPEHGLLRARERQDVLGREAGVRRRDRGAQRVRPPGPQVAEGEPVELLAGARASEAQQLADGERLRV